MIFLICSLAVWRITAALVYEKTFNWLRDRAKTYMLGEDGQPTTFWGKVLSCFWCTSSLVAVPFGIFCQIQEPLDALLYVLALSGAAILLNHLSRIALYAEK